MFLHKDERILKIYYHHYTPFLVHILKLFTATLPFYFILFMMHNSFSFKIILMFHLIIIMLFSVVAVYLTLVYWLDRLIVTNKRLIFVDWEYLTVKTEHESELTDIQDITSKENGLFALIPFFDYGTIEIETASAGTFIVFHQAPDPNGIKKFIYSHVPHHEHNSSLQ